MSHMQQSQIASIIKAREQIQAAGALNQQEAIQGASPYSEGITSQIREMDVVLDETYLPVSYKGNHSKQMDFVMPRAANERGGENHKI